MAELHTDVRYIKGIGEQRAKVLGKLGVATLRDLIAYFPRTYEDRRLRRTIRALVTGESACVAAMVAAPPTLSRVRRGLELVKLRAVDATGVLDVTFFNQPYRRDSLKAGETYVFYGRAEGTPQRRQMVNPLVEREGAAVLTGRLVPVYPLTAGISQLQLISAIRQGLDACRGLLSDPLPEQVRRDNQLCHIDYAYDHIHFPDSPETLAIARRRLVFEELFLLTIGLQRLRGRRLAVRSFPCRPPAMEDFLRRLPFPLTQAQQRVIGEIRADMAAGRPMNRLVQGDVGSGKTMVAAAAVFCAARNGLQSALMAPTEILAEQHYRSLSPLMEGLGISCALLTGSLRAAQRRSLLDRLRTGEIQLIIGTHALISGDVDYARLGLVITDEQHRFGVNQRSALSAKGENPHLLVMSATPIPRTLALILYGDLDVSLIDQLPPGRQKVDTFSVPGSYHPRIYAFLRRLIGEGRQAYIVCPLVENGDGSVPDERKAAAEYARTLQGEVFPDLSVGLLHGRMKPREKEAVMAAFSRGEIHILVSTTVVEVGVDVPNAAVMVVENADRFGLSQLHQLRGRVGRGQHKSYCILVSDSASPDTRERLAAMTRISDGFRLAEEDLRLRGPGDFFGQRQHGLPALRIADLSCDTALLHRARESARDLLRRDPDLADHPLIAQRLQALFTEKQDAMN